MSDTFDVTLVVNNDKDAKRFMNADTAFEPFVTVYNELFKDDKKAAWALKNEYGAKECPFIEIKKNGEFFKAIWKEASADPIGDLIKLLNSL